MGFISTAASGLSKIVIAVLFITFLPGLPPTNIKFESYTVKPPLPLTGVLSLNDKLDNVEKLFENEIKGPESFVVYNSELYTGLHGGYVVKIVNDKVVPVVKFGEKCDGYYEESKCGRPLGLTIDNKGSLYVADAYYGIYKHNLTTGKSERLVAGDDTIEGKPVKLLNSIAVANDGTVYYTVSSCSYKIEDGLYTALGNGNGRLMKYNPVTKYNELLMDNFHFANGIILSEDESFLLVAETFMSRLIRYHLKGAQKGSSDVFIDRLPGLPDNLQKNGKDGFIVSLVMSVDENEPCLFQQLAEYPLVRRLLARLLTLLELPAVVIQNYYPNFYSQVAVHFIGHFESMVKILPKSKRSTVLFLNKDGKITKSLHGTGPTKVVGVSDFIEWNGYYYLGSPFNAFLARVKAS